MIDDLLTLYTSSKSKVVLVIYFFIAVVCLTCSDILYMHMQTQSSLDIQYLGDWEGRVMTSSKFRVFTLLILPPIQMHDKLILFSSYNLSLLTTQLVFVW